MSKSVDKDRLSGALGGIMSPRPTRSAIQEENVAPAPAPSKAKNQAPKKARKPRKSETEGTMDVTVRLTRNQTLYLDSVVLDLRRHREQAISRSEIVRSLIDLLESDAGLRQKLFYAL